MERLSLPIKKTISKILSSIHKIKGRPLRVASREMAGRDLKRVGRNINLLHQENIDAE